MQIGVRDGRVMGERAESQWCLRSSRHWRDFGFSSDEMEAIGEFEPKSAHAMTYIQKGQSYWD